eukprot:gene6182-9466_t
MKKIHAVIALAIWSALLVFIDLGGFFASPPHYLLAPLRRLSDDDYRDPGPEILPEMSGDDAATAARIGAREAQRLRHARAQFLKSRGRDTPSSCLPDGRLGSDERDAWMMAGRSTAKGALLPLTAEVQGAIWDHQHPADCKSASFFVWKLWNSGLGADIHTYAQALAFAMASGRVLLVDTNEAWWYALDKQPSSIECFFVPPSSCTLADAGPAILITPRYQWSPRYKKVVAALGRPVRPYPQQPRTVGSTLRAVGSVGNPWSTVPRAEWQAYGYQWWMAQASRYLLRMPQPWLRAALRRWVDETFPGGVPPKMIGMHVRHGDKYKEMQLLPLSLYMDHAEKLRAAEPDLVDIFVSTEDPKVLNETAFYTSRGWRFHWCDHFRSNAGSPMDYAMLMGPSLLGE